MKLTFISFMLLLPFFASGQQIIKTYYNKDGDREVDESHSYYYTVRNDRLRSTEDTIKSYFTKTTTLRSITPLYGGRQEGETVLYHENGEIKAKATYRLGGIIGDVLSYYPDKNRQSVESYASLGSFQLVNYWDSLGNQIIKDGEGSCRCVFNVLNGNEKLEIGKLKAGLRDSVWIGIGKNGKIEREENYADGVLLQGAFIDHKGTKYNYDKIEEAASPKGGMAGAYEYIGKKLKYPKDARRAGIEGKVYVQFIVGRDGVLTDVRVIQGINIDCDAEAVRVIQAMPPWLPGRYRGEPVRQKLVIPVPFRSR